MYTMTPKINEQKKHNKQEKHNNPEQTSSPISGGGFIA